VPDDREQPADGWLLYRGTGEPHDGADDLPQPPPWRATNSERRATTYRIGDDERFLANVAVRLRRPLLVTGRPGSGKTSLAASVASELNLGSVLRWSITSNSSLADGLYSYDAIGRLHDVSLPPDHQDRHDDIGRYFRLGPLGTALLPHDRPRVLLIDNLDRSDVALPDELLDVLGDGGFGIPELERLAEDQAENDVYTADPDHRDRRVRVHRGLVSGGPPPLVVITSNGEREFGPDFRQRCVELNLRPPGREQLAIILAAHLGPGFLERHGPFAQELLDRAVHHGASVERVLDTFYVAMSDDQPPSEDVRKRLPDVLLRPSGVAGS
jgi:MoxR-like ATPase